MPRHRISELLLTNFSCIRERHHIWRGELEWQEKVKDGPADQKIAHSVACTVSASKVHTIFEGLFNGSVYRKIKKKLLPIKGLYFNFTKFDYT